MSHNMDTKTVDPVENYLLELIAKTRDRKIPWARANPTTFVSTQPSLAASIQIQRLPTQILVPGRKPTPETLLAGDMSTPNRIIAGHLFQVFDLSTRNVPLTLNPTKS